MKVAYTSRTDKDSWGTTTATNKSFSNTELAIYKALNSSFYNTLSDPIKSLIVQNSKWSIGAVSGNVKEVKSLMQTEEKAVTFNANVGLLSVSDYANATYTLSCRKDFTQYVCATTNYLVMDKEYFLINTVKGASQVWTVSNNFENALGKTDFSSLKTIIPVINLKATAEINGGVGSSTNPYKLVTSN